MILKKSFWIYQYISTLNFKKVSLLLWEIHTKYLCHIQIVGRYNIYFNIPAGQINYVSDDRFLSF